MYSTRNIPEICFTRMLAQCGHFIEYLVPSRSASRSAASGRQDSGEGFWRQQGMGLALIGESTENLVS